MTKQLIIIESPEMERTKELIEIYGRDIKIGQIIDKFNTRKVILC